MISTMDWLLEPSQPAVRYLALTEILGRKRSDPDVREAYSQIAKRGWVFDILKEQLPGGYWHNYAILNRPKYITTVWKFLLLADLGLRADNRKLAKSCALMSERYLKYPVNFHFCMTANISRALLQAGYSKNQDYVTKALDWIVKVQKDDGGWHCFPSKRGTLDCWEALSLFAAIPRSSWTRRIKRSAERGAEFYLERRLHKQGGRKYPPYFRFHYPVHYYHDLLVGLDVLTSLGYGDDERLAFAVDHLRRKQRKTDGRWLLDAVQPDLAPGSAYSFSLPWKQDDHATRASDFEQNCT
jgi:hypothetical protein